MKKSTEDIIYNAIVGVCEGREIQGSYRGNGHHLAQELSRHVAVELLPKLQRKIFDSVSIYQPASVGIIAKRCGMSSRIVSTQLQNIYEKMDGLKFVKNGRLKIWSKCSDYNF